MKKTAGLNLRIERELRDRFSEACQQDGDSAAAVIRRLMRNYLAERERGIQGDLFEPPTGRDPVARSPRGPVRAAPTSTVTGRRGTVR